MHISDFILSSKFQFVVIDTNNRERIQKFKMSFRKKNWLTSIDPQRFLTMLVTAARAASYKVIEIPKTLLKEWINKCNWQSA